MFQIANHGNFHPNQHGCFPGFQTPFLAFIGLGGIKRWTFVFFATRSTENPEWLNKLI
jgi:hypothetical protein